MPASRSRRNSENDRPMKKPRACGGGERHEYPRISGQGGASRIRRSDPARHCRLQRRRSGQGRERTRRPGLGGESADPCRRTRQGRRRQGRQIDRRREEGSRAHPRLDAGHASDRPQGQAGQSPLHRRRLGDREGILSLDAGRSRNLARRDRGLDRRRHEYRRGRARHAGKDHDHHRRSGDQYLPASRARDVARRSASTPICRSR